MILTKDKSLEVLTTNYHDLYHMYGDLDWYYIVEDAESSIEPYITDRWEGGVIVDGEKYLVPYFDEASQEWKGGGVGSCWMKA